ncbi:hypothetical protein D1AOALGA4SA_4445 [Olavius algarvensis Delta 1 endosymbiont]|nr:hypothetical protein D1AOALGA4SA_4445 [Olavius algarvensis Delta 1 endosymbiont]
MKKHQISSSKFQTNIKFKISMTETCDLRTQYLSLFRIWVIVIWILFVICGLIFVI